MPSGKEVPVSIHGISEKELIEYDVAAARKRLSRSQYLLSLIRSAHSNSDSVPDQDRIKNSLEELLKNFSKEERVARLQEIIQTSRLKKRVEGMRIKAAKELLDKETGGLRRP